MVQKILEEKHNVKINIIVMPTGSDLQAKVNLLMADKTQRPDVIWYETAWTKEYKQWLDAGLLVDITDFYFKYPNIREYYEGFTPDSIFYAAEADGKLYRVPGDVGEPGHMTMILRKDWLDFNGLDVPTTYQDWVAALRAFKTNNPANSPEAFPFTNNGNELRSFMPWWSYYNVVCDNFRFLADGKTVGYGAVQPEMKEALAEIQSLFAEGLIDPSILDKQFTITEKQAAGNYGSTYRWIASFNPESQGYKNFKANVPDGEIVPVEPFVNPTGTQSDRSISPAAWAAFSITDIAGDKAERIYAFFDSLAGDPDYFTKRYGVRGEHYTYDNGVYKMILTDDENQAQNIGRNLFSDFVNRKDSFNLSNIPEVVALFERGTELVQTDLKRNCNVKTSDRPMWNQYRPDLEKIRDEYIWGIIGNQRPVSDFDIMVELFEKSGGKEATEETQKLMDAQVAEYENFWNVFKP